MAKDPKKIDIHPPSPDPAAPDLTRARAEAVVPDPAADWPEPSPTPGDEGNVAKFHAALNTITDVGTLAHLSQSVLNRAKLHRVRPEVLHDIIAPYAKLTKDTK